MKNEKNAFWSFFSSIKLALFTLIILAIASIGGTLVQQNQEYGVYVQQYGESTAKILHLLGITNTYGSWWFISLLVVLSLNLIVCTIDRLPGVWRLVWMNNLETDPERLEKMGRSRTFTTGSAAPDVAAAIEKSMTEAGWQPQKAARDSGTLFFAQKGNWTRLGVYIVHSSVLIIFVGAIIGSIWGYKASVMIPEGGTAEAVYHTGTNEPIPLGFGLRLDKFTLSYYDTGAPKEYRSDLTVIENNAPVLSKSIVVNDPLTYKGLTFYQASYQQGAADFALKIDDLETGTSKTIVTPPRRETRWAEQGLTIGIVNVAGTGPTDPQLKIFLSGKEGAPSTFWLAPRITKQLDVGGRKVAVTFAGVEQQWYTGLQVAKDPGVWWVYAGCTIMLLGFIVAFFMSHQRIWVLVQPNTNGAKVLVAGSSNKNRLGFEKNFDQLYDLLQGGRE